MCAARKIGKLFRRNSIGNEFEQPLKHIYIKMPPLKKVKKSSALRGVIVLELKRTNNNTIHQQQ